MKNIADRYIESSEKDGVGTAWQFAVREEKAVEEAENPYWKDLNLSLKNAVVKEIDRSLAKDIIETYEWLGCMPAISQYYYGIFFDGVCGGVVVFGTEYAENTGVWDKYDFTGKIILLSRGVCLHWTPKNTNSKLIMSAIKMLPEKYEVVTATVDSMAGEIGTIYQACNFNYVGIMRKTKSRSGFILDGKLYGSRSIRAKFGTQKKERLLELRPDIQFIKQVSKSRYFMFRGRHKKTHLSAIKHLIKEYPKRKSTGD